MAVGESESLGSVTQGSLGHPQSQQQLCVGRSAHTKFSLGL